MVSLSQIKQAQVKLLAQNAGRAARSKTLKDLLSNSLKSVKRLGLRYMELMGGGNKAVVQPYKDFMSGIQTAMGSALEKKNQGLFTKLKDLYGNAWTTARGISPGFQIKGPGGQLITISNDPRLAAELNKSMAAQTATYGTGLGLLGVLGSNLTEKAAAADTKPVKVAKDGPIDYKQRRRRLMIALSTLLGAGIGAKNGAIISTLNKGRPGRGALIGAGVGGLTGAAVGGLSNRLREWAGADPMLQTVAIGKE